MSDLKRVSQTSEPVDKINKNEKKTVLQLDYLSDDGYDQSEVKGEDHINNPKDADK